MGPANEGATSSSRDLSRVADVVIRPEEQNRNHWTKVSNDTFVLMELPRSCNSRSLVSSR
jgi:hypothetical protein